MSQISCSYRGCRNKSKNNGISMFRFPAHDTNLLPVWIRNSGNVDLQYIACQELYKKHICAVHFQDSFISKGRRRSRLLKNAVPVHFRTEEDSELPPSPPTLQVMTPNKFYKAREKAQEKDSSITKDSLMSSQFSNQGGKSELVVKEEPTELQGAWWGEGGWWEAGGVKTELDIGPEQLTPVDMYYNLRAVKCESKASSDSEKAPRGDEPLAHDDTLSGGNSDDMLLNTVSESTKEETRCTVSESAQEETRTDCVATESKSTPTKQQTVGTFICDYCNRWFHLKCALVKHINKHAVKVAHEKRKTKNVEMSNARTVVVCDYCKMQFTRKANLIIHLKKHNFACSVCNKTFHCNTNLSAHARIHKGLKMHECSFCGKIFQSKIHLSVHERTHTGETLYECPVCNIKIKYLSSFNRHMRIHTGEKAYPCSVCKKRFIRMDCLSTHMLIHTEKTPHICSVCNKKFKTARSLLDHMKLHTCETFLLDHMKLHNLETFLQCSLCSRRFKRKSHLTVHMRIHTGELPFHCRVCNKKFRHGSTLSHHMLIHSDNYPYECPVCNKNFRHNTNMHKHMKLHNKSK